MTTLRTLSADPAFDPLTEPLSVPGETTSTPADALLTEAGAYLITEAGAYLTKE